MEKGIILLKSQAFRANLWVKPLDHGMCEALWLYCIEFTTNIQSWVCFGPFELEHKAKYNLVV